MKVFNSISEFFLKLKQEFRTLKALFTQLIHFRFTHKLLFINFVLLSQQQQPQT